MQLDDKKIPGTPQAENNLPTEEPEVSGGQAESFALSQLLENVSYPASKEDIIDYAQGRGAEDEIMDMLEQLPEVTYNSSSDVSQALGENSQVFNP